MKASFKLGNLRRTLAISGGLALTVSLLGVLPAAAEDTTSSTNAAPTTNAAPATDAAKPANAAKKADTAKTADAAKKTDAAKTETAADPKNVASAAKTTDQDALSDYNNWVTLGVGSTFVHGDAAQFQHQHDTKSGVFGGVQDFHWEQLIGKDWSLTVDGHAMVGNHDYDFKFDLTDEKIGYLRAGYTEFRTWYDGNGGFYPPNNEAFHLYDNDLYVDRRSAWIEAGLTLPDLPVFSVRYEYDSREGLMDSTSWADNDSGTPSSLPADRKIVPTYLGINETRNIIQGDIKDKLDNTDMGLTLRYEMDNTKDSTFINLDPGQAPGTTSNNSRFVTDDDYERNDMFNVHGFTETFFNDKVTFSSGFSYVNMDTTLGGSRIYGPGYNAPFSNAYSSTGFFNLGGGGFTKEYISNMNLMVTPIKDLTFIPAVRIEYDDSNISDNFTNTATGGALTPEGANTNNWSLSVAESLEARYTGFQDWSLYASGEWSEDWGNDTWNSAPVLNTENFNQDWSRLCQKYTVGANWYPLPQLNFGGQYYHQIHAYDYSPNGELPSIEGVQYPGYLQKQYFTTDDMNFRATWMALSNLSLVTRYDLQYSSVNTTSDPNNGSIATASPVGEIQSCNITDHIISENVSWTPLACLNLQAGGSYVINSVDTPVAGSAGINNIVLNGMNDYWTLDASAGYEFNEKTHLQLQYNFYRADDYVNNAGIAKTSATTPGNAGLPYGAGGEQNSITATITRQISKEVQVSVKYGYYTNRDETSGGQNDYNAQLVYVSTQLKF